MENYYTWLQHNSKWTPTPDYKIPESRRFNYVSWIEKDFDASSLTAKAGINNYLLFYQL